MHFLCVYVSQQVGLDSLDIFAHVFVDWSRQCAFCVATFEQILQAQNKELAQAALDSAVDGVRGLNSSDPDPGQDDGGGAAAAGGGSGMCSVIM
jgi:hypothetical protein